ncbi:hypothetical protein [Bradyrhizobium sp. USDA 10063]
MHERRTLSKRLKAALQNKKVQDNAKRQASESAAAEAAKKDRLKQEPKQFWSEAKGGISGGPSSASTYRSTSTASNIS